MGDSTKMVFVGDHGRILTYDTGTNEVVNVTSPTSDALCGVWGSSFEDVWIVGVRELILRGSLAQ